MGKKAFMAGWALVLLLTIGLAGCGDGDDGSVDVTSSREPVDGSGGDPATPPALFCDENAPALEAGRVDAVTQSTDIDGTTIDVAMTLYTPALDKGECAPLIVHSHGFGGSRITDLDDVADDANASDLATRQAWESGYFVVSFDQRGFGETGGRVMVENPDFEGRDTTAVIDYAIERIGGHLAYRRGDPVLGALGLGHRVGDELRAVGGVEFAECGDDRCAVLRPGGLELRGVADLQVSGRKCSVRVVGGHVRHGELHQSCCLCVHAKAWALFLKADNRGGQTSRPR